MRKHKAGALSKEDVFVRLTVAQMIAAAMLGGIFFGAYKLSAETFSELKSGYSRLMAEDKDIHELIPYNFWRETTTAEQTDIAVSESIGASEEQMAESTERSEEPTTENMSGAGGEDEPENGSISVSAEVPEGLNAVMPVNGSFTSFFGSRIHPIYGTEGFHSGIDIAAPEGSPVVAALDGIVKDCGTGEMSGNYVKLDNGGGIETLYCHCSEITVQKGQTVNRGEVIALVGQTGLATGPHLHFELHRDGVKCDPAVLLENAVSVY